MDHASVDGASDPSNYGDDEDENEPPRVKRSAMKQQQSPKIPAKSSLRPQSRDMDVPERSASTTSFFAPERMSNPEFDSYLLS